MPSVAVPSAPPPVRDRLEAWCATGATGALRLLDQPGGAVYLVDGRISYAECPTACGTDRLLTASGRLSGDAWRAALAAGRPTRRVGAALLEAGLLAPAELEALVLAGLYGAAYFLFDEPAPVHFEVGTRHVLGPIVALELRTVQAELDRRRRLLREAWPDESIDTAVVVPARRLPGHQVALTALQWEIVANADRRRTAVDLARALGRDTFAMLLAARRLARVGLVEPGRPGTLPTRGASRVREEPTPEPEPEDPGPLQDDGELPRRRSVRPALVQWAGPDCSESTLLRIRDGLALL